MTTWLNRLSNLFLLCLCSCCQLLIIRDSFGCQTAPSMWLWLLLLCALLWISTSFHRGIWIGMPLSAFLLLLVFRSYDANPGLELRDLIDRISAAFYTHVTHPGEVYPYANAAASHSFVLLLLGFFLAAYLTTALHSRSLRISLSMLETLPIFTACVMVNSDMPALPTLGMLLFWFLLLAGGNAFIPGGSIFRTLLCTLLPVALILGGLLLKFGPDQYSFDEKNRALNLRFNQLAEYFDLLAGRRGPSELYSDGDEDSQEANAPRSSYQNAWDGENNSMKLQNPFDEEQAELCLMQIRASTTGRVYLRGRSYGDYAGDGWLPAEELKSGTSLPFAAYAAAISPNGVKRELEIRTLYDLGTLCIPYYAAVSSDSDSYVTQADQVNYRVNYIDYRGSVFDLKLPGDAAAGEAVYRPHAHSVFTKLPDRTKEQALQICRQAGLSSSDPNIIPAVAAYVQQIGEYDLSTAGYPSDDYAIYFLTASHRGYCIHYATAATVLYRALGIPARITEGFAAETRAGEFSPVLAADAHAWVEVYLDGVGWIPVEVTSYSGVATVENQPSPTLVPEDRPEDQAQPRPDGGSLSPDQPGGGSGDLDQPGGGEGEGPGGGGRSFPWLLLLIPPGLILVLTLWYLITRARFLSQTRNQDGRKAVLACWRYARRAAAFGGEIPQQIVQSAEKVAFSPHRIKRDELELCRGELDALIETRYAKLRPFAKFRFRFLRGLK